MLKNSLLFTLGASIFVLGVVLFPMPVPLGLPTMIVGATLMLKTSHRVRKKFIQLAHAHDYSRELWRKARSIKQHLRKK